MPVLDNPSLFCARIIRVLVLVSFILVLISCVVVPNRSNGPMSEIPWVTQFHVLAGVGLLGSMCVLSGLGFWLLGQNVGKVKSCVQNDGWPDWVVFQVLRDQKRLNPLLLLIPLVWFPVLATGFYGWSLPGFDVSLHRTLSGFAMGFLVIASPLVALEVPGSCRRVRAMEQTAHPEACSSRVSPSEVD